MAETYKVKILAQKVFHDGTSMIVLNPKNKDNPEVEYRFIQGLVDEGVIEKPRGFTVEAAEVTELAEDADKALVQDGGPALATEAP
jgi:hypothetical protein